MLNTTGEEHFKMFGKKGSIQHFYYCKIRWARQDFLTSTGGILGRVFRKNVTLILSFSQIYLTKRFLTFFSFSEVLN
jgi:hypothetical protein